MSDSDENNTITESEPVPVSKKQLTALVQKVTTNTKMYDAKIVELESKLMAKDKIIQEYHEALTELQAEYNKIATKKKIPPADLSKLLQQMKSTEEELDSNRKKRIEAIYKEKYEYEVEELRNKLKRV